MEIPLIWMDFWPRNLDHQGEGLKETFCWAKEEGPLENPGGLPKRQWMIGGFYRGH